MCSLRCWRITAKASLWLECGGNFVVVVLLVTRRGQAYLPTLIRPFALFFISCNNNCTGSGLSCNCQTSLMAIFYCCPPKASFPCFFVRWVVAVASETLGFEISPNRGWFVYDLLVLSVGQAANVTFFSNTSRLVQCLCALSEALVCLLIFSGFLTNWRATGSSENCGWTCSTKR